LIIKGHYLGDRRRDAEILEVLGPDGREPYRVRWDDDGHESIFYPSSDAWVQHLTVPEPAPVTRPPGTLAEARVRDSMRTDIISCSPHATVAEAAAMMSRHRIHCVAVSSSDEAEGTAWTVLSDLDLVGAALAGDGDAPVGRFTAVPTVTIDPDDTMERAAQLMTEYAAAHLVVVEPGAARPVGIVSTLDMAALLALITGIRDAEDAAATADRS
jgi:CBS domain-containing protein